MRSYTVNEFTKPVTPSDGADLQPHGTEVVMQVQRCGVCHTDLHLQDGFYDIGGGKRLNLAERGIKPPVVLGHEVLGRLKLKGPDAPVDDDDLGKTFLVYPWLGCGVCDVCLRGQENLCTKPSSIGVFRPGGYAEQCLVPHPRYLIDVTGINPSLAATCACSGLTAYSALLKADVDKSRDTLLITGVGGVGSSALSIALALGFKHIAVADLDPDKRSWALEQGAVLALDPRDENAQATLAARGGVGAVVDFVGNQSTVNFGLASLRKGGGCIVVGLFGGEVTIPLPPLVQRAISLRGSYVGSLAELKSLIELMKSGLVRPLPTEDLALGEVNAALERLRRGEVRGRLVLSSEATG